MALPTINDDGGNPDDEPGRKGPQQTGSTPEQQQEWVEDQVAAEQQALPDPAELPNEIPVDVEDQQDVVETPPDTAGPEELDFTPPEDVPFPDVNAPPQSPVQDVFGLGDSAPSLDESVPGEETPTQFPETLAEYLEQHPDEKLPGGTPPQDEPFFPGMPGSEFQDEKFPTGDGLDTRASAEADYRASVQERDAAEYSLLLALAQENREMARKFRELLIYIERDRIE